MPDQDTGTDSTERDSRTCPVSRRAFLAGAASVGVGAAGTASASETVTADRSVMSEEYEYVLDNAASGDRIPTYIDVWSEFALDYIEEVGENLRTTGGPQAAAYAELTPEEAGDVSENFLVTGMEFAPGANPFWRHAEYPDGEVFPEPAEALDYIAYEEAVAAFEYFEETYPDRFAAEVIAESPGLVDDLEGERTSHDVWLAEITNDVNEDTSDKEKVICSVSIHGDERSGVESALRTIEDVLSGGDPEIEQRLDDIVLVVILSNPDGWISRIPRTVNAEDQSTDAFMRLTGSENDPNRQYPTVGTIDPGRYPAESNGANLRDDDAGIDDDVPGEYRDQVPDALGIVDRLREYDNVGFVADFHGMYGSEYLVKGLLMNDPYGPDGHAVMDAFNETLQERMDDAAGPLLRKNSEAIERAARARARRGGPPQDVYTYGTITDTIGYTADGAIGSWLTNDTENGGLDAPGLVFEMALDNSNFGVQLDYRPELVETQVAAYRAAIGQMVVQTTEDVDTSIDDNGRSLGYVDSPSVVRSSDDLPFAETDVEQLSGEVQTAEAGKIRIDEPAHTLSITVREAVPGVETATVDGPGVSRTQAVGDDGFVRGADWLLTDVDPGVWNVRVDGDDGRAAVDVTVVYAADSPDPGEVLGFEQRSYEVTPTAYFEDYSDELAGGTVTSADVDAVADGALLDGDDPAVDVLTVIHDDGAGNRAYVDAIDEYLRAGGELVLTDSGVSLLSELDAGGAGSISARDLQETTSRFATLDGKRNHPLLDGIRDIEQEIWTVLTVGYASDDGAPMTLVDERAFERAGGEVAATASGDVVLGELDSITVVGSILPPASQENLHPFGLGDYGLSSMGHRLFLNAVGHDQR